MSMDRPTFVARLTRRPLPVLLGVVIGFVGCCIVGRVAATQQPYKNFVRFHLGVSPEAHYYPTYSQTLNLARQHIKPGKILVIVSGDSVLHGVGQRPTHVWTLHLQKLLGDDYVVLNLAVRAGVPQEFGGLIADQLKAEGVPLILVCRGNIGEWDGLKHRFFFWDAWGKGYVQPDPRRDKWLTDFSRSHAKDEAALEMRRSGCIDGMTYSQDLWNYVAYKYRGTIWTPLKYPKFWQPHRKFPDNEPGPAIPFEAIHNPSTDPVELSIVRNIMNSGYATALREGKLDLVGEAYKTGIPDRLIDSTLYVFRVDGMYYRLKLSSAEREKFEQTYRLYGEALRRVGIETRVVGEKFDQKDYADRSHLSESGGKKLAEDIAPTIRTMCERLYKSK